MTRVVTRLMAALGSAERRWTFTAFNSAFILVVMLTMIAGRPPMQGQSVESDNVQTEKIARVNDHLAATDRTVEENKAQIRLMVAQYGTLEAQVNQWKGAEDVWLKIISLLAGGGIILQVSSKFVRTEQKKKAD